MLGWLRPKADCPVDPATRAWVDGRWDWLESQFGLDRLRNTSVILPHAEFFPDPYHGDEAGVRRMLDCVCGHMAIDPATVELSLYEDRSPVHEGRWRPGTAGLYQPDGAGKFRVWVEVSNLNDPLGLVATIAHELGHVHLLGHGRISDAEEDDEPLTDLLTVFLGMGVFTANAVLREDYWHAGVVSGWSMSRRGYLDMPAYGYAFARFARARSEDGSDWSGELRLDVRAAFHAAMRFLAVEELGPSAGGRDREANTGAARHGEDPPDHGQSSDDREESSETEDGDEEVREQTRCCRYCGCELDVEDTVSPMTSNEFEPPRTCAECHESIGQNRRALVEEAECEASRRPMRLFVWVLVFATAALLALDLWDRLSN
ncbi:MAG: hypothetical protein WD069_20590 [Planctomycetales bacterium]